MTQFEDAFDLIQRLSGMGNVDMHELREEDLVGRLKFLAEEAFDIGLTAGQMARRWVLDQAVKRAFK